MRYVIYVVFTLSITGLLGQSGVNNDYSRVKRGETLYYKIKYGWFKIGDSEVTVDSKIHYFDEEPYYHIHFNLKAQGLLKLFSNLNLDMDSYVHAETFRPYKSIHTVRNGKRENFYYDDFSYSDSIYVHSWKNQNSKKKYGFKETGKLFVDALGSYLSIRAMNLDMKRSENMQLYYSHKVYDFGITPDRSLISRSDRHLKSYQIRLPDIDEFAVDKESYVIFRGDQNVVEEMKLATSDGNIYLVLEE